MSISTYIVIMTVLVIMSAYFSATETSFSTINKTRLKTMAEKGNKKADAALRLSERYDKLISTILIGNNIVNIALSSIATVMFISLNEDYGATIATVVVTVIVLVFGEISPKTMAKNAPETFAMFSVPIIRFFILILAPINFLFSLWPKLLMKLIKVENNSKMSQEELIMLVEEVQQEGAIDDDESDLIKNAIEFAEQIAGDILTHRVDLEAVPIDATKAEIARMFAKTRFSRLLVYEESIDNIIGVIHLKDFFDEDGICDEDTKDIMTEPIFIQKSEKINSLLKLLQRSKSHIAVVVDEYGGTLGIVTMEDILEELVGEIWDEHDEVVETFVLNENGSYTVDCSADFDNFCDFFGIEDETDTVSVAGWIGEKLEKIPDIDDSFDFANLSITVTETDTHRVTKADVVVRESKDTDVSEE